MKPRGLVIDDDPAVRESIGKVLERAGYVVTTAADSEDQEVRVGSEQIDLVLLDLNLPSQSGWDVFERLTTQHPSLPVIIITGMPDQYRTALAAGVGALMEKPLEVASLLEIMGELLAEPREARLRRMCGYQQDTKYWRRSMRGSGKMHGPPTKLGARRPAGAKGWARPGG